MHLVLIKLYKAHRMWYRLCSILKEPSRTLDAASEIYPGAISDSIPEAIPEGIPNWLIAGALASIQVVF